MIEFRHLRYFLGVVEHGSVAEAARRLHIAQPALSRQIKDLEEEMGALLFDRSVRGATLTAAGQQLAIDARRMLGELQETRQRVARVAEGVEGNLRMGITPNFGWHPRILGSLRSFHQAEPRIAMSLEPGLSARQLERIREGELDAGFLAWRYPPNDQFLAGEFNEIEVFECRLKLALPRDSRLARQVPVHLSALREEPAIWFPTEVAPGYDQFLDYQCQTAGLVPRKAQLASDVLSILGLVAAGVGYAIVSDVSAYTCPEGVVLVDHPELTMRHPVSFVYRADNGNPTLGRYIAHLEGAQPLPMTDTTG
ncbi:LysR family transcriptional regulator [Herbaspirillum frisingense]|uniref:LysR family transcriptional regulator n=2 Tax=Herbaspirillum TaxID=963 RepID=UPI001F198D0D|nr:LysR family transcriptional regulator [Herbaspirillum frisingense]